MVSSQQQSVMAYTAARQTQINSCVSDRSSKPAFLLSHLLQAAAQDSNSVVTVLDQITRSHYSIAGCEAWRQLLELLPVLLHHAATAASKYTSTTHPSSHTTSSPPINDAEGSIAAASIAIAVEQFILQKLAPEVLDCCPEPLADVLITLMTASCQQPAAAQAAEAHTNNLQPHDISTSSNDSNGTTSYRDLSSSAVQLLVVGLHKIARQWHFLDELLSQRLSQAIVDVLCIPLQLQLAAASSSVQGITDQRPRQQRQQVQPGAADLAHPTARDEPEPLQQHVCCCLAEQLLLADAGMGWLHRLNASSASGRSLRKAMVSRGFVEQLVGWLQLSTNCHSSAAAGDELALQRQEESNILSSSGVMLGNSRGLTAQSGQQLQHCRCIADQMLSTVMETPAGRRLLSGQQQDDAHQHTSATRSGSRQQQSGVIMEASQQQVGSMLSLAMSRMLTVSEQSQQGSACGAAVVSAAAEAARLAIRATEQSG